jgi:hypothetical protein
MAYAKDTSVPVERTEAEIKGVIRRYGATSFASFETNLAAMIAFEMQGRRIVFKLPLPDREAEEFRLTPSTKKPRSLDARTAAWEQACRSRWRALFLCIKAKLESVEAGIESFEDAFLAHIQMPDGLTVGEHVRPRIAIAYETKSMQPLLPAPEEPRG